MQTKRPGDEREKQEGAFAKVAQNDGICIFCILGQEGSSVRFAYLRMTAFKSRRMKIHRHGIHIKIRLRSLGDEVNLTKLFHGVLSIS